MRDARGLMGRSARPLPAPKAHLSRVFNSINSKMFLFGSGNILTHNLYTALGPDVARQDGRIRAIPLLVKSRGTLKKWQDRNRQFSG